MTPHHDQLDPTDRLGRPAWIRACVIGELLGFIPPAATGAVLVMADAPEVVVVVGLVIAGVFEGLVLGAVQSRVIRRAIPGVSGWTEATGIAAGLAWLAGMGGSSLVQAIGPVGLIVAVPGWMVGLLAMGTMQARCLATAVEDAWRWIPVTTAAWLLGVSIPVIALSVTPNQWNPALHVIVGVTSAVAMGATVGVLTSRTLDRFVAESRTRSARATIDL